MSDFQDTEETLYTVSKTFSFCYGHRLMDDTGRCRHLHGHTARATIILSSERLNNSGMVCHFDRLKETIGAWISNNIDHTLLLSKQDPLVKMLGDAGEKLLALPFNPTAENIAHILFDKTKEFGLPVQQVEVWESETSKATYAGGECG